MNIKVKKILVFVLTFSIMCLQFLGLSVQASTASNTATINISSKKQTIRGFGAASVWCGALSDSRMNTLYSDIGLSIVRVRIAPNENWKSGDYRAWADELSNAKKASAKGAIVFATPWTPPASMKTNNSVNHGSLKTSSYADYADYLKSFVKYFADNGVKLYGMSLQNEPDWDPDYEGCVWTADQFDNFIKNYGATISSVTKLIMPESLGFNQAMSDTTLNDSSACPYVSIVGGHLYGATIKDYPLARSKGKDIWMTEHLLEDQTISGCMTTAKEINDCMTVGNMNAYVWWWINSDSCGFYNNAGVIQKRAYILGQFSKFIRNGYNRVDATSNPQSNIYISGYTGDNKVTIVAINQGNSNVTQSFNIQNSNVSSVSSWVTSGSLSMAKSSSDTNVSNGNFTASLPAQSVTTFVGNLDGTNNPDGDTGGNSDADALFKSLTLTKGYKPLTQGNPCMTQKFTADPGVMEYNGRVYVYTTNDQYIYDSNGAVTDNTYNVQSINCMSSSDMKNWTDHGTINVAGNNGVAKWAGYSWAPTAAHKTINGKEKFFLYFANNANGIGVLTSDSPTGPWTDPIGHALISRSTANCSGVTWLFDPAVLVDSDGSGYLYFGGGVPTNQSARPQTARVVKLGSDMISLASDPVTIDAPFMFEDSGINKIGNTYYYSYCTNWASRANSSDPGAAMIAYMTSSSPTGPFTYSGTILDNPGKFFGYYGNNHHTIIQFNNKSYIFYHSQWLENQMGTNKGYRCTHVDEINISNGTISQATGTLTGVAQVKDLDPYTSNQMSTMAWQGGINVSGLGNTTVEMNAGDWLGVSNAAFGTGAASITMKAASKNGAIIKVCVDDPSNAAAGYISIPATGSTSTLTNMSANISNITGTKKLFFVASGDCVVDSWQFSKDPASETGGTTMGDTITLNDGWYYIKNVNSQKYLQVANNTGKAGQNVELSTGTGVQGQKWYLTNVGDGYVTLKSASGDYMLDVCSGENKDGSNIQIYNAYGNTAQKFSIKSSSTSKAYAIATMCSDQTKVLDGYKAGTSDGTNVCQWTYEGHNNQLWAFEPTTNSGGSGNIKYGDMNGDNKVNILDYLLLKRYINHTNVKSLSDSNLKAADVNGDGNVDSSDYILLKDYLIGKITHFPAE